MLSIDVYIQLKQFIAISAKIFNITFLKMYGSPVNRCCIIAMKDDMAEIFAFKNLLMLTNKQVEIKILLSHDKDKIRQEDTTTILEALHDIINYQELVDRILRSYLRMYPCSFVINIVEDQHQDFPNILSWILKKLVIVQSRS